MKSKLILFVLTFATSFTSYSQNQIIYPQGGLIGALSLYFSKRNNA
jgi:hypothetical protein